MIPLGMEATDCVLSWGDALHRTVALHHAAIHARPGLWGDDPRRPSSVVWLREGDDQLEAFGAGFATPAIDWLVGQAKGRPISMIAPPSWEEPARARSDWAESAFVQTWLRPDPKDKPATPVMVRRLGRSDLAAFQADAPSWACRAWSGYEALIARGAAFGVPMGSGFAALAWTFESDHHCDKIGVATLPRYRRLGLGRAAAGALIEYVTRVRRKHPLWTTAATNTASVQLARSLGFTTQLTETRLRWTPNHPVACPLAG